jgi:hypothetical protein
MIGGACEALIPKHQEQADLLRNDGMPSLLAGEGKGAHCHALIQRPATVYGPPFAIAC